MDEARSVSYSINVRANTSQAEASIRNVTSSLGGLQGSGGRINISADSSQADSSIRNVTSNLGGLQSQASSVGSAFRSSFLAAVDGGNTFSSSLRSGVGGAFSYVMGQANAFRENVVSGAQNIANGFAHPISTIRNGLGNAIQSAKDRFTDYIRNAERAATATDDMGGSAGGARQDVSNLGEAAEESGGKFEKLGGVLKGAGAAIAGVSAAAAAGAVALGVQVVSAYSDYEQLVGGIDTLFGKASQTVQANAANAYATAGMSANQYMELTTSFSASLIKSLGNDTDKAASYANSAIVDMSDNANKMGTDLELIQNAYRGFSMQNYTMLDNLKLGYSGTQEEMERLLSDAEKLSGKKFDISNFADITEAIHIIQEDMGIAGTTALEASETIAGSISSTKSAIGNLIAGLGNANADIGMLVDNVVDSFGNVVKNVTPVVENLAAALPDAISKVIPAIGSLLPTLVSTAGSVFGQVLSSIIALLPQLIPVAVDAISLIAETLLENVPLIVDAAVNLATGLGDSLPTLIPTIIEGLMSAVNTLIENAPLLMEAGMQLLMGLAQGIIEAIPMLIEQLPIIITSIVEFISGNLPAILETGVNVLIQLAAGIIQAIPQLVAQLPQIISAIVNGIGALIGSIVEVGKNIVRGIWDGITAMAGWIKDKVTGFFSGIVDGVKGFLGIHSPSRVFAGIGNNMAAGLGQGFENTMGGVTKDIENAIPTKFDMPAINGPANAAFKVNPIVGDAPAPVVADATYSVTPVVGDFDPPDPNTEDGDGDGTHVDVPDPDPVPGGGGGSPAFAPQITVIVQGNADEESTENLKTSLRDTVRELYNEFREEERERMVLKNQYAY